MPNGVRLAVVAAAVAALPSLALGQTTRTWIDSTAVDRLYHVAANWSPTGVPGTLDTIVFANPTTNAVRLVNWNDVTGSTATFRVEILGNGPIRFQNSGVTPQTHFSNSLLIDDGSLDIQPQLTLGLTNSGVVDIKNSGGLIVRDGALFDAPLSPLELGNQGAIDAVGSTLSIQGTANTRRSTLGVSAGSIAFAAVSNANGIWNSSEDLIVGAAGRGDLTISGGGRVVNRDATLGSEAGGNGAAIVAGAGSLWTNTRNLTLGRSSGGSVANVTIGPGARLNVGDTAANATFSVAFSYVEDSSANTSDGGILRVQGGGTLTNNNGGLSIGETAGTSGRVIVSGTGSTISDNDTFVGFSGTGSIEVDAGGSFTSDNLYLATSGGTASVSVTGMGSSLATTGDAFIGDFSGGGTSTTTISSGGRLNVGTLPSAAAGINVAHSGPIGSPGGSIFVRPGNTLTNTSGATTLGFSAGTNGRLQVAGAGAVVNDVSTIVGFSGTGLLQIAAGGQLNTGFAGAGVFGGSGTITVDGANSRLWASTDLLAGGGANGASAVSTTNGGRILVGDLANQPGVLAINDMIVSDADNYASNLGGRVSIRNGSTLNHAGNVIVASQFNEYGAMTVTNANSKLIAAGTTVIGRLGSAELSITDGGALQATDVTLAEAASSATTALVSGPASRMDVSNRLIVGQQGSAELNIEGGGRVQSGQDTMIARFVGSGVPVVNVRGVDAASGTRSTLAVTQMLEIGFNRSGTLNIEAGGHVTADRVNAGLGANAVGSINVSGVGSSLITNQFFLGGFGGVGVITIDGGLVSVNVFLMDPYSKIDIRSGSLQVNYFGTSSSPTQIRDLILTGYAGGAWTGNGITSAAAQADPRLAVGYVDSGGVLTVKVTLAGDATLDATVNFDDLLKLAVSYNQTGKLWGDGDFTYDGVVNFDDLLKLAVNYNQTLTGSFDGDWAMAQSLVPEPGAFALLSLGTLSLRRMRRSGNA